MKPGFLLRTVLREARGSSARLTFLVLCLALGVAAVTGVSVLVAAMDGAIASNARRLLAADIAVETREDLPTPLLEAVAAEPDLELTRITEFPTMAAAPERDGRVGASRLVELRAVDGEFPFHGGLRLAPDRPLSELLDARSAVVAPELRAVLDLELGDELLIGGEPFTLVADVLEEPDRLEFSLALGPRVFISAEGLARTTLTGLGSRVENKLLLRAAGRGRRELDALAERLQDTVPEGRRVRVRTWREAGANLQRGLRRVERYAALAALLSLVLGATGASQVVRAWIQGRTRSVAILRCLGMRPREILLVSLGQVLGMAAVGCVLGALLGALVPQLVLDLAGGLLPGAELPFWQPAAMLRGCLVGLSVALVFSLPPLLAIWRVSPARVLRAEVEPLPPPRWMSAAVVVVLGAGLFGVAWFQSGDAEAAGAFSVGLLVTALVLVIASRFVMRLVAALPRERVPATLRLGLGALARPGAGTTAGIVALGLGVLVVAHMALVEGRLDEELEDMLPKDAPSAFLVDVQPTQWTGVRDLLLAHRASQVDSVPVVTARLRSIDGRPVSELLEERQAHGSGRGRNEWRLTREQRLTWMDELPDDNTLVAGALWSDDSVDELSIEREFAEDIDVGIGSQVTFDVQGVAVPLTVTSIRDVEWRSFGINFFLVVEPGVLDDAPHMRLATTRLSDGDQPLARDAVAAAHPNVALIGIREILERVAGLVGRMSAGVRLLGAFTVATGLLVLGGAVASSSLRRRREAALLKTLGVERRGVATLFGLEYALSGAVAGCVGGLFALVLSQVFLDQVLEIDPQLPWFTAWAACVAGAALLSTICGLLTSWRALAVPCRAVLSEDRG